MESVSEQEGRTVMFVSHNMAAINNLCDKGLLLSNGKIIAQGAVKQVVNQYLSDNKNKAGEFEWCEGKIPENKFVRLLTAKVVSEGRVSSQVNISKKICIEIAYESLDDNAYLYTSIHINDTFGNCVLASVNFPSGTLERDEYACQKMSKGTYITRCTLPKNFLNNVDYIVSVLILRHDMSVVLMHEDILRFTGVDTGEMSREFSGHWIGLVRPKLSWKTTHVQ